MVRLTPTLLPLNALPMQPNGRPMQRALLPTSKLVCNTTFINTSYSVKPGQPTWMAGRKQHGKKLNASKKSRTWDLPCTIETIHSDLIITISSIRVPMPHVMHLAMTASYQWMLTLHLHHIPQHHL